MRIYDKTSDWSWRGVLAGAYRGRQEERATLAHLASDALERTLCGKVKHERMVDVCAPVGDGPRCPECLKRST